jgi:acyl-CoA thioesterase-1
MRILAIAALGISLIISPAIASSINIVAFGASNTNGKGVSSNEAFPAQIESMLRAKGVDAHVSVSAINGRDSAELLSAVDSEIPDGTTLVLIEPVRKNDEKHGLSMSENASNLEAIKARLAQRKIKSVVVEMRPLPDDGLQGDGQHLSPHGHQVVAARMAPKVLAMLRSH